MNKLPDSGAPGVLVTALALATFALLIAGCPVPGGVGEIPLSSTKTITAFSFASPATTGATNENAKSIAVTVPYGTDVRALVATFTTTGSSVKVGSAVQVSGAIANYFSRPIIYTVTAADGSQATYMVTVTAASSSAKAITAFSFPRVAAAGTIDESAKTIAQTVPFGTNVTALTATFTTTGSSVKVGPAVQVSGTSANNFTSPVVYTVTAVDGSTVSYKVSVTVILSSKAITAFTFASPPATGTIDENTKTIGVTVTYGTDLTALVARFTTTGLSAKVGSTVQLSGTTANNFSSPVIYTVTAADGSTMSYTVKVAAAPRSWHTVGTAGFSTGRVDDISLAIDSTGTPYIAYEDWANGGKATVMKYTGGSWQTVGMAGFSAGLACFVSLAIDSMGTPYVAYEDYGNASKATVMKYTGGSWQTVGTAGFSLGQAAYASLAIDRTGTPYVAYQDGSYAMATVMKYTDGSWQMVGTAGFSAGRVREISLAIDSRGAPYVAYEDWANSYKATVMKYTGRSWQTVGTAGFSAGRIWYTSLAIDSTGTPYVAYEDYGNANKATVMKYTCGSWQTVGTAGFSTGRAADISLAIDSTGTPYIAYEDNADGLNTVVMKYAGRSWHTVGTAGFSLNGAFSTSLAIDSMGIPYAAYEDYGNSRRATVMKFW